MSIGNLPDNKLMSLALQGYNPFQPDVGIFCGGYQGPLYPNPTILSCPGFDPYLYTNPIASLYQMSNYYTGLGIGNPGIDYKNPGHILGLLDTFARMSYGIGVLKAIHEGNDGAGGIDPAINILIPMTTTEGATTLGMEDIYPSLCEIPTDWLNGFTVGANGEISPDPRPMASFNVGSGHIPITNPIDAEQLNRLFANKTIFSYIGMPQYLRTIIESLASVADNLINKAEFEFTLDNAIVFNNYCHQSQFFDELPDPEPLWSGEPPINIERISEGKCYAQCINRNAEQALKILTGSTDYHNGMNGQNEYRSLTELNSIINLVPLQVVGATYWIDTYGYIHRWPYGDAYAYAGREFRVASYMIADLVINVSNISSNAITIAGEAIVRSLITDPTAYYSTREARLFGDPDTVTFEYGCTQDIKKTVDIQMSMTNQFAWDKVWLDKNAVDDSDSYWDQMAENTEYGGMIPGSGFITLDQSDLIVPFNREFTLDAGCTSIRMRIFIQNRHMVGQRSHTPAYWWFTEEFWPGFVYGAQLNDPNSVPDNLASPNMELSFTVIGTNMDPIICNVSI